MARESAGLEELLRGFVRESDLTRDQQQASVAPFELEPDRPLFEAVNALTRAAQPEEAFEAHYQMEWAGAVLIARVER